MHNDPRISRPAHPTLPSAVAGEPIGVWMLLLLAVFAAGLCRDISEPWVGLHDWNGAFFSQLARNLLRYPTSVHHGMPLVAVGAAAPPPAECSIYATHPPALVWLVAGTFRLLGESEITARLLPILASLGSLALLVGLVRRAHGRAAARLTGAIYALMPMSVYFGRMVNHEAICLFCILAAAAAWCVVSDAGATRGVRRWAGAGWAIAVTLGIWVDWPVLLFAGLFCLHLVGAAWRRRIDRRTAVAAIGVVVLAAASMLAFLVYAGLDGRWADLGAVFLSRTGSGDDAGPRMQAPAQGAWAFTLANLSWPVLVCAVVGLLLGVRRVLSRRKATGGELRAERRAGSRAASVGLSLVALTGLIWLLVFWRQYELHSYWMYYLSPAGALFAAQAFAAARRRLAGRSALISYGCLSILLVMTGVFELRGARDYFDTAYPDLMYDVRAWKGIHDRTSPGDRLLLHRDAVRAESHGGYRFRNIVPPQLAYYLDRPFDVESSLDRVPQAAATHVLFVLPIKDAVMKGGRLHALRVQFREELVAGAVVFDLRRAPAAPSPARETPTRP